MTFVKSVVSHPLALLCSVLLAAPPGWCCLLLPDRSCCSSTERPSTPQPEKEACCCCAAHGERPAEAPAPEPADAPQVCCCENPPLALAEKPIDLSPDSGLIAIVEVDLPMPALARSLDAVAGPTPSSRLHVIHCVWRC